MKLRTEERKFRHRPNLPLGCKQPEILITCEDYRIIRQFKYGKYEYWFEKWMQDKAGWAFSSEPRRSWHRLKMYKVPKILVHIVMYLVQKHNYRHIIIEKGMGDDPYTED